MKTNFLFLLFVSLLLCKSASAQSPALTITCGAPVIGDCSGRPNNSLHTYIVTMQNVTSCDNGNWCKYKWEVTNGTIVGGTGTPSTFEGNGANSITVKWNNFNGNGSVKVTSGVPSTPTGSGCPSCPTLTTTKSIPIKYLGAPGNIKINGVAYSGSYELSCGTSPITVSVDPATNATSYAWSKPAGWGISGSGNSVTMTPTAGGGGTISVSASRSDVSGLSTSSSLNITRPLPTKPTINSGDILLCTPQNITATASNATSYEWVGTGGITPSGTTNSAYVTGTSDGTLKVRSYSSTCVAYSAYSDYINIKKSAPNQGAVQVTANGGGSPDFMCNGSGVDLNVWTGEPGTNWGAWTVSDPANTYFNYSGPTAYFNSYVNNCYGIDITVSNCFGTVHKGITICVDNCGAKAATAYTVFPNPTNDKINISFDNVKNIATLPSTISLLSEKNGKQVKSLNTKKEYTNSNFQGSKKIEIDVKDLPRGTYFLHMRGAKGETNKLRIILE